MISKILNSQLTFGSKNSPVKPFKIETTQGALSVRELSKSNIKASSEFMFDCLVSSGDDGWDKYKNCDKATKKHVLSWFNTLTEHCLNKEDGNSTVLVAKDKNNKIKAYFNLQNFDEMDMLYKTGLKDAKTGFVQSCYVASDYRSQKVGEKILEKMLPTANGFFTDILLSAGKQAVTFYQKMGFVPCENISSESKKVTDFFMSKPDKDGTVLMYKSINKLEPCWNRLVKLIK